MYHPLTWLYRKLGRHYPGVFFSIEVPNALVVAAGSVALFSFYYQVSKHDFLTILAITLGLTAIGVVVVLMRMLERSRPLKEWIGGARSPEETVRAWHTAVNLPIKLIKAAQ